MLGRIGFSSRTGAVLRWVGGLAAVSDALPGSLEAERIATFPQNLFDEQILNASGSVLDLLPVGVLVCDRDGIIAGHNRAAAELWGHEPKLGDTIERICGAYRSLDGGARPHELLADLLKGGSHIVSQVIHREHANGSPTSIVLSMDALKDQLGNIVGATICGQNAGNAGRLPRAMPDDERRMREWPDALPVAVYATDAEGRITFYNQAAVELWGRRPEIGKSTWCGSWQLFRTDGSPLPHDECPMAIALKEGRAIKGAPAMLERPDGTRVRFRAYPTPFTDETGAIVGALNTLIDVTEYEHAEEIRQQLVSIVESSQDAIIAKDLSGIITNWNHGAEQLFGYTAEEVIGKPITILIPHDHLDEELDILGRIRRGERVDHYETVRRRKDGSLVEISLMVSPIRNADGRIVGASKIARDITERHRAEEQRQLLLREMNHRVKNLFSLASGVVTLSARSAETPEDLAIAVRERLAALARAHDLTLPDLSRGAVRAETAIDLHSLVSTIISPFDDTKPGGARVAIDGPDVWVGISAVTGVALLLHEFATNAAKYGAFSAPGGRIKIDWSIAEGMLLLQWEELGGPPLEAPGDDAAGFGTMLARRIVGGQLGGRISHIWKRAGLIINLSLPLAVLSS
jgi:PAS domain S-box-containing protein